MLYGIEGILNGKLFGGSSGGGESGGGGSDYWVPTDKNGEIWIGEEVASGSLGFEIDVDPSQIIFDRPEFGVYRITIDGVAYVCSSVGGLNGVTAGGLIAFKYMNKGYWRVTFTDSLSHTLSVESWVPQMADLAA